MRLTPEIKRDTHASGAPRRRRCAPMAPLDALPPAGLPDARDLPRAGGQAPIACRAAPGRQGRARVGEIRGGMRSPTADLAASSTTPSGRAAAVWFDSLAYCRRTLLSNAAVPWASPGEIAAFFGKSQRTFRSDALLVDLGGVFAWRTLSVRDGGCDEHGNRHGR